MAVPGCGAACAGGLVWGGAEGNLRSGCTQNTKGTGWEEQEMQQHQTQLSPGFPAALLLSEGRGL